MNRRRTSFSAEGFAISEDLLMLLEELDLEVSDIEHGDIERDSRGPFIATTVRLRPKGATA